MGYSIGVLNSIRTEASEEYQNRIPEATQQNIANIGMALQQYTPLYNEFCEALINKIGKTILESKLFKNRLARFKQGTILDQKDVEEIFIEMAKAESAYDPAGPNPLGRRELPDVKTIYHRMNRQDVYCISIGDTDFLRVFKSEATLDSFITRLINSVYSGAEYDEWLAMKNLVATYDGYFTVDVPEIGLDFEGMYPAIEHGIGGEASNVRDSIEATNTGDNVNNILSYRAKSFVKACRKLAMDVSFPSKQFNKAGVMTWSNPSEMVLMVDKDMLTEIDVEVLAKTFNMGKTDIQFEVVPMDDFGSMTDTVGILVDKDWFRVYDTLSHFEPQRNAHGLFTNYFYHVHQILSASTFKNAIRFVAKKATA